MNKAKKISVILFAVLAILTFFSGVSFKVKNVARAEEVGSEYAAQIGSATYTSLEEAVSSAQAGDTVQLLKNVTLTGQLLLDKSLTLDLNQKIIALNGDLNISVNHPDAAVTVKNGTVKYSDETVDSKVKPIDVVAAKETVISGVKIASDSLYCVYLEDGLEGTTTVENCQITCSKSASSFYPTCIYNAASGATVIRNCTLYSKDTCINVNGKGETTIEGCTVLYAKYVAFHVDETCSSVTKIIGCTINLASNGVFDYSRGETIVEGCDFKDCRSYGVYIKKTAAADEKTAPIEITNTKITCTKYGICYYKGTGKLTVTECEINSPTGITGNGNNAGTDVTVINTKIIATGCGIYQPQDGTLVIDGGEIKADTVGVEIRAGSLTVKNNTIVTLPAETKFHSQENGSGTTVAGAAIAVSQHYTAAMPPINVHVESATLTADKSFVQVDTKPEEPKVEITIMIDDGSFTGGVFSNRVTQFIGGGEYSEPPVKEYLAENAVSFHEENGKYLVLSDVERAKRDARYYLMLYAATKNVEYTEEINAIIFDDKILTVLGVDTAKMKAIEKINGIYEERLAQAERDAVAALEAEKEKALERINRALDGLIASGTATEIGLTDVKREGLCALYGDKMARLIERDYREAVAAVQSANAIEEARSAADGFGSKAATAAYSFENQESTAEKIDGIEVTNHLPFYILLAISVALAAVVFILAIVLLCRKRKTIESDGEESNTVLQNKKTSKTFETRLNEAPCAVLNAYTEIKNEFYSYAGVKSRICKHYESFRIGMKLFAKVKLLGKSLRLYLALAPERYDVKKYHHADKSDKKAYAPVPMMVKVTGPRSLSQAKTLIADCMRGVKKNDESVR